MIRDAPAQEYVAYTVPLAPMPEHLRTAILAAIPTEGSERPKEIGDPLLMLDPNVLAVKAYLHFVRPENGTACFRRLLSAKP